MVAQAQANKLYNGFFTVKNPATGVHKTIRIQTRKTGKMEGRRMVGILVGSNNTRDYWDVGEVRENGTFRLFSNSEGTDNGNLVAFIVKVLTFGHPGCEVNESRHCIRCNRVLTHPESLESGLGPECAKLL